MSSKRVVVIGAGMSGILAGVRLKEAGYDFVILEKADKVAGTWRENRYPGLTCDIPSHIYTYSFAPNPNWTQTFPPGPELFAYFDRVAREQGLMEQIRFGEEVVRTRYVDADRQWAIETAKGEELRADIVISATGVLHHPSHPDIAGMDSFGGRMFHSAEWEDDAPLDGRVAVIGSGSTGIQIVAALADRAAQVTHFQRTPQWVMAADNRKFTEEERTRFAADEALLKALRDPPEHREAMRQFTIAVTDASSPQMAGLEAAALKNLETVKDPVLREKLRPDYRAACKRLIMSPDYYRKVQQPNVDVVRDRIERIEPTGIRTTDGELREFDTIVFATGFKAHNFMRPMHVIGRDGVELNERWARRPSAYLATTMPDFPNLFLLNGPSAPFGNFSNIGTVENQMNYVMGLLDLLDERNARAVAVSAEAMATYDRELKEQVKGTIWASGCNSWYLDEDGVPTIWPYSLEAFIDRTSSPELADLEFVD